MILGGLLWSWVLLIDSNKDKVLIFGFVFVFWGVLLFELRGMEQETGKSKRLYQVWSGSNVSFYLVSDFSMILFLFWWKRLLSCYLKLIVWWFGVLIIMDLWFRCWVEIIIISLLGFCVFLTKHEVVSYISIIIRIL